MGRRETRVGKRRDQSPALSRAEEAERLEGVGDPADQFIPVTPYRRVYHAVLPILHAGFLQRSNAVGTIMLQLRILSLNGVTGASGAQARQRKMVVQSDHPFRIVEALDVLVWFRKVLRAVHVLKHVHIPARTIVESRMRFLRAAIFWKR